MSRDYEVTRLQAQLDNQRSSLQEASEIIQALARLIAGWEHLPTVPDYLQRQAEKFGADFSD